MQRLFAGNFDFEHRLAGNPSKALSDSVRRVNAELASIWVGIADDGDRILTDAVVEDGFYESLAARGFPDVRTVRTAEQAWNGSPDPSDWELVPWGALDSFAGWSAKHGIRYAAPSEAVVRQANSRRFSFELEKSWDIGLPGSSVLHSPRDLEGTLRQLPPEFDRWVIKAEFSMSARERILGRGRTPNDATVNWLNHRMQHGGVAFFEPWVERVDEVGLQFEIAGSNDIRLLGVTELLTDASGAYSGSRLGSRDVDESEWHTAIDVGRRAAARLAEIGYFGPLGIDAVRYRAPDGSLPLRPIQDINARYTMGRIALGFRRMLRDGESATWLHLRSPIAKAVAEPGAGIDDAFAWWENLERRVPSGSRLTRTSPLIVDGTPTRLITALLISADGESHRRTERNLLHDASA